MANIKEVLMKKIEHWKWMTKEKTINKVVYKGDKELIQEIEMLEDEVCSLKKEVAALKIQLTDYKKDTYAESYYTVPLTRQYQAMYTPTTIQWSTSNSQIYGGEPTGGLPDAVAIYGNNR